MLKRFIVNVLFSLKHHLSVFNKKKVFKYIKNNSKDISLIDFSLF